MKFPVAVRLDENVYERVKRISEDDRRTLSNVLALAIEAGLPALEKRLRSLPAEPVKEPARTEAFA
jgi:predicted DNA-binding protein